MPDTPVSHNHIPVEEWRAPEPVVLPAGSLALRLASARTGFLRYAVAGGALIGAFASALATGAESRAEISATMVIGAFVGFGIGIALGWTTFRVVERVANDATPSRRVASVVAFGIALPAYVVAGVGASVAGALAGEMPPADIAALVPDVLRLLLFSGLVLLPIAVVFGRNDPSRPATLSAALSQVDDLTTNPTGLSRTFWGVAVAVAMFVVGFVVALLVAWAVQIIAPGIWQSLAEDFGSAFLPLFIGLWILAGVLGWKGAMRFIDWVRGSGVDDSQPHG